MAQLISNEVLGKYLDCLIILILRIISDLFKRSQNLIKNLTQPKQRPYNCFWLKYIIVICVFSAPMLPVIHHVHLKSLKNNQATLSRPALRWPTRPHLPRLLMSFAKTVPTLSLPRSAWRTKLMVQPNATMASMLEKWWPPRRTISLLNVTPKWNVLRGVCVFLFCYLLSLCHIRCMALEIARRLSDSSCDLDFSTRSSSSSSDNGTSFVICRLRKDRRATGEKGGERKGGI